LVTSYQWLVTRTYLKIKSLELRVIIYSLPRWRVLQKPVSRLPLPPGEDRGERIDIFQYINLYEFYSIPLTLALSRRERGSFFRFLQHPYQERRTLVIIIVD